VAHWLDKVVTLLQAETSDLRELARMAGDSENTFYVGVDIEQLDFSQQDLRGLIFTNFVEVRLSKIERTPRREERIVLVLDCVLCNRSYGCEVLEKYFDNRSDDVHDAVNSLRQALKIESGIYKRTTRTSALSIYVDNVMSRSANNKELSDVALVDLVRQVHSRTLPTSRDYLFYYMVRHLSKYPEVKEYLRGKYLQSKGSFGLNRRHTGRSYNFRPVIEQYLFDHLNPTED